MKCRPGCTSTVDAWAGAGGATLDALGGLPVWGLPANPTFFSVHDGSAELA